MGLMRRLVLGDLDLTDYPFSVEFDEDHGSPENVYDTLVSMLADGELMSSNRVGSREITLTVLVEGPTLADLATNEATLIAECEKQRSTLAIDPGDTYAVSSVFDIFRVQARLQYDANLEQANFRRYELTIPASPYPRPEEPIVTPAAGSAAETVLDAGSSTTSWSAAMGPGDAAVTILSFASTGGLLTVTLDVTSGLRAGFVRFTRTGTLAVSDYVSVDFTSSAATHPPGASLVVDGQTTTKVMTLDLGGGVRRYFFRLPAGVTSVSSLVYGTSGAFADNNTVAIDKVSTWTALPFFGTARQKALSITPGGSVRTQGSVAVQHASNALGKVIVYTHPSGTGYLPPLRPWRLSSAAVTTDSTLVSGARNAIGTTNTVYQIPAANLPEGRAEVWAWLRETSAVITRQVDWAIASYMGSTLLDYDIRATQVAFTAVNGWQLVCLGAATMPPVQLGPAGYVQVHLHTGVTTVEVDEAYLFATDQGRLTVVDCGTGSPAAGGPSNRLWIDAPSLERPMGGIYRGNAADRSDQWHAGFLADVPQTHDFSPAGTNVFVATAGTIDAETSLTHYRRFHTHVAGS